MTVVLTVKVRVASVGSVLPAVSVARPLPPLSTFTMPLLPMSTSSLSPDATFSMSACTLSFSLELPEKVVGPSLPRSSSVTRTLPEMACVRGP